ncbi:hypothetical protein TNCV_2197431 [Trichonephila clavipes]|nr:hypothetical protein TNCV_2197431 [Trichonephila clavipes]
MLDHLEDNIRRVIADIRPQMLENVIGNWTSRLDYIRASRGSHMPEVIFKILGSRTHVNNPRVRVLVLLMTYRAKELIHVKNVRTQTSPNGVVKDFRNYYCKEGQFSLMLERFNVHQPPLHGKSLVTPGLEPYTSRLRVRHATRRLLVTALLILNQCQEMRTKLELALPSSVDHSTPWEDERVSAGNSVTFPFILHHITPKSWDRTVRRPLNFASDWTNSPRYSTRREVSAFTKLRKAREYFDSPHRRNFTTSGQGTRIKIAGKQWTIPGLASDLCTVALAAKINEKPFKLERLVKGDHALLHRRTRRLDVASKEVGKRWHRAVSLKDYVSETSKLSAPAGRKIRDAAINVEITDDVSKRYLCLILETVVHTTWNQMNLVWWLGFSSREIIRFMCYYDRGLPCHEFEPSTTKNPQ